MAGEEIVNSIPAFESYSQISSFLGISTKTFLIAIFLITIWALIWKGFGLWKSVSNKKIIWFVSMLVANTAGIIEIPYIFLFSKIKDMKSFKKVHNNLLILALISSILTIVVFYFYKLPFEQNLPVIILLVLSVIFIGLFSISLMQKMLDEKEWTWLIFSILLIFILLTPLVALLYFLALVKREAKSKKK